MIRFMACAALAAVFLLNVSCAKRPQELTPSSPNAHEIAAPLVGVHWQMSSFTLDRPADLTGDGRADTDLIAFLKGADTGMVLTFAADGSLTIQPPGTLTTQPGRWSYTPATKMLRIVNANNIGVTNWHVVGITATTLTIGVTITEAGQSLAATMIWKHS